jgi:hypothetical protein
MDFYENIVKTTSSPSLSSSLYALNPHLYYNVSYHITTWSEPAHTPIAALLPLDDVPFAMLPFHDYMSL